MHLAIFTIEFYCSSHEFSLFLKEMLIIIFIKYIFNYIFFLYFHISFLFFIYFHISFL